MRRQQLIISHEVLKQLQRSRQRRITQPEAGGQLFATIDEELVHIRAASAPHTSDIRHRFGCMFDPNRSNKEIQKYFNSGLHYIGDWHTHPQKAPVPSSVDMNSMRKAFSKSKHQLNYFVMMIVGIGDMDFYIALINDSKLLTASLKYDDENWICEW